MNRATIIRGRVTRRRIIERVIRRRQAFRIVSHEVRHNHADSMFFVIEHDGCATTRACAQLQRTIGISSVEGLTIQTVEIVYGEVSVIKEDNMGRVLPGDSFTDGALAGVVVDRVVHSSFADPDAPADAPPRESIETRCLVFF